MYKIARLAEAKLKTSNFQNRLDVAMDEPMLVQTIQGLALRNVFPMLGGWRGGGGGTGTG